MSFSINVFTLFPEYISGPCSLALLGKAQDNDIVSIKATNIRDYAAGVHKSVDDTPYGGGAGMVMKPEPLVAALKDVQPARPIYVLSASGKKFDQSMANELKTGEGFSLICGRYEGIDQRVIDNYTDGEICVGDFVLAGGEAAALIIIEAVTRLLPGVMGNDQSEIHESFSQPDRVEAPQFTKPSLFEGHEVPEVLLSGDHKAIEKWREEQSLEKTRRNRPDLVE